jgi:hypothetical protein
MDTLQPAKLEDFVKKTSLGRHATQSNDTAIVRLARKLTENLQTDWLDRNVMEMNEGYRDTRTPRIK